jgi:hypothetical protein
VGKDIKERKENLGHYKWGCKLLLCLQAAEEVFAAGIFPLEVEPRWERCCEFVCCVGELTAKVIKWEKKSKAHGVG